jgi:hypothetical protein
MIAEQYINEGIRIRKSYIQNLKEILKQEPIIFERKTIFEKLKDDMEATVTSDINEARKILELNNKLITIEKEIRVIQNIIKPYYDAIESLRTDKDRLYLAIKEKYPNITQEEIEKDIMSRVEE